MADPAPDMRPFAKGQVPFVQGVHALRALAAFAVVIYHAGGSIGAQSYQGIAWIKTATRGLDVGVDLFFVISGFVIALPFFAGRKRAPLGFLKERALRIYPMALLTAAIFAGFGWLAFARVPTVETVLSSFLLLPMQAQPVPIVLWTLKQELLFYAIFSLCYLRPRLGLWIVLIWAAVSPLVSLQGAVGEWAFHPSNVQFGFGIAVAWLFIQGRGRHPYALPGLMLSAALMMLVAYARQLYGFPQAPAALILGLSGAGIIWSLCMLRLRLPKGVLFLGTASYSIYLIHFFFISLGNKLLTELVPELPGLIALTILSVGATFLGCGYYLLFERPLERLRKRQRAPNAGQSAAQGVAP